MRTLAGYWLAGGPLMVPLAALCFAIWLWTVKLYGGLLRAARSAAGLNEALHTGAAGPVLERIREWAARASGPLARAAGYALGGELPPAEVLDRLTEARMAELPPFESDLNVLKAMVAAAPLVGLLGTVKGMIETFTALATHGAASMEMISSGISEALVTTQAGLVVALPGLVGAYASGRLLARLGAAFDRLGAHLAAGPARGGARP